MAISAPRASRYAAFASGLVAVAVLLTVMLAGSAGAASKKPGLSSAESITFLTTLFTPVTEHQAVQEVVMSGFKAKNVDFVSSATPAFLARVTAEAQTGSGTIGLVGGNAGDIEGVVGALTDLSSVAAQLKNAGIPASLWAQAKLGTKQQLAIPWTQATYVMAANKKALPYLPKGAVINSLTWGQFHQWAKNLQQHFGSPQIGFPVAGLFPRFLQGYLVPSFTGRLVTKFKTAQAASGWLYLKNLWRFVNPQSSTYSEMSTPLLSSDVMVAWDHVARLATALKTKPDDFVVFPTPAGPKGRGYLPVVAVLAIPKSSPDVATAKQLISYLDNISTQAKMISADAFFPVVSQKLSLRLGTGMLKIAAAIKKQQTAKDSLPSVLPIGLGTQGGTYASVFLTSFQQIVLQFKPWRDVLNTQGDTLQTLLNAAGAHCWTPDPPSNGVCQVG